MEPDVLRAIEERVAALANRHCPDMPPRERDVLILEYFGFEIDEVAAFLGTSRSTIKNQLNQARYRVTPNSYTPNRTLAALWTELHRPCCLATDFALLQLGHGFSSG